MGGIAAIERQPADDRHLASVALWQDARRSKNAERDWQIKRRAHFAHIRGREAHRDALPAGNGKPELRIAVRTRSLLSRTVVSGKPTIAMPGNPPPETSTSTDTGCASTPKTAAA